MSIQQAYNDVRQALQNKKDVSWMPELKTETLTVNATTDCDNEQVWSKISEFQPTQGWIQTLDKVHLIESGQMPESDDHLISAELVNANNESLHIRPANKGKLSAVRFTPSQGEEYWVTQTQHQIKHGKQTGTAHYQLYWAANETQTQPAFSRLVEISR